MAFEEPNEAHTDHFRNQDIVPETAIKLQTASMLLGQVLRRGGDQLLSLPEPKRKNILFKDGSLKFRFVLEWWFTEKNNRRWNAISGLRGMFSDGSVERSGQKGAEDRRAIFGATHTNIGSRYCIVLFCGQEFTPVTEPVHYHHDKPGQNTYVKT